MRQWKESCVAALQCNTKPHRQLHCDTDRQSGQSSQSTHIGCVGMCGILTYHSYYNPKSEKVGTVWKTQIKKKVVISKFTLTCISLQTIWTQIFHVLSGQLHVICKYTSFPVIQTCNTFQKKLGQEQFRASNEVNWLNNDVIWNSWCQQVIVIMIWYKSSIQERSSPLGAKMGRGSPVCQQIREKIIEMFKNNVPQRKIGRDLDISPSTVHNIIIWRNFSA